jgi:hypothetical protein
MKMRNIRNILRPLSSALIVCALLCAHAPFAAAQSAKTHVVDYARDASGNPLSGKVTFILTQKSADSADGLVIASPSVSATLDSTGKFDISVYPSASLSPVSYYQVYVTSGAGNQTFLGVYNIPSSVTPVTIQPYKVLNANLAAQYTFASLPAVQALAASAATLGASGVANHALLRAEGGALQASGVSDDGTTVSISRNTHVTGTLTASAFAGNGSALTGIGVGTSTGHSAPSSVSIIADSDNSGGGSNDAGGIIDFITGITTRARLHNSGQFEFMAGTKTSGGADFFTGTYTDSRSTAPQTFPRDDTLLDQGTTVYINNYFRSARGSAGGGQFGLFSEIASDANVSNGASSERWVVGVYGGAVSPEGNTGDAALYGGNFVVTADPGATVPRWVRVVEADINNNVEDSDVFEPADSYAFGTSIGAEVISGGFYMPTYGIRVGATNPTYEGVTYNNRFRVGLRIGQEAWSFRAVELHNPPVAQGNGLVVGQMLTTVAYPTINFARDLDSGINSASSFILFRNASLSTDLFKVDWNGNIATFGSLRLGGATQSSLFSGTGAPTYAANVGSLYLRLDGGAGSTLYIKESGNGTSSGWVAK